MEQEMNSRKAMELEQLKQRVDEASTPHQKNAALNHLLQYLDTYVAENDRLVEDIRPTDLKKRQEDMRARLEAWDIEAREILEREISDPEILNAALDNTRYKEQVIAIAGTPFSKLVEDSEQSEVVEAEEISENAEEHEELSDGARRIIGALLWVVGIVVITVVVLALLDGR